MVNQKVTGENCFNCRYIDQADMPVDSSELNEQGGIDPLSTEEMVKAKRADLLTLPNGEKTEVTMKRFCNNEAIDMFVTERMCCVYWDNEGAKRPWIKTSEPEYVDEIL